MSARIEYPVSTMLRAIELREGGWELERVRELLTAEGLGAPTTKTIQRWVDPDYAERQAEFGRRAHRRFGASRARFRLSSNTPEYRLAFLRTLREQGLSCQALGVVHGVVFGERLSEWQVRNLFSEDDPKPLIQGRRQAREASAA
jgi:hypothetical protein